MSRTYKERAVATKCSVFFLCISVLGNVSLLHLKWRAKGVHPGETHVVGKTSHALMGCANQQVQIDNPASALLLLLLQYTQVVFQVLSNGMYGVLMGGFGIFVLKGVSKNLSNDYLADIWLAGGWKKVPGLA